MTLSKQNELEKVCWNLLLFLLFLDFLDEARLSDEDDRDRPIEITCFFASF